MPSSTNVEGECPRFDPDGSRFDQSTYVGRFRGFLEVVDPRTLFCSDDELTHAKGMLEEFSTTGTLPKGVSDADMWEAKKVRDSVVHPGTGETINPLMRMSGFVPINVPIIAGMLGTTSLAGTLCVRSMWRSKACANLSCVCCRVACRSCNNSYVVVLHDAATDFGRYSHRATKFVLFFIHALHQFFVIITIIIN
jgi:hypothetical protein